MATHQILFGTYDMTDIIESHDDGANTRINAQAVNKRHGALITNEPVLEPRKIRMTGTLYGTTKEELRDKIRELAKELGYERKKLKIFTDRYWNARKIRLSHAYITGSALLSAKFSIEFFCDDPYEYSDDGANTTTVVLDTGDTVLDPTNNLYETTFNLTNNGEEFTFIRVTVTADQGGNVDQVVVRNESISRLETYVGSILAGNALVMDNATFAVLNNGVEDLNNWAGDFLWVEPGVNSFTIQGNPATYKFEFTERWY